MILIFSIYLVIGMVAGIMAGLLGVGGGLLIVPALLWAFSIQDLPHPLTMHMAIGTSLASVCATSIASMYAHHKYNAVLWDKVAIMAPGIIIGAMGGAMLATWLSAEIVRLLFIIFVFTTAVQMLLGLKPPPSRQFPGYFGVTIAGLLIGGVSAVAGIGGGSIVVPYLIWCNVPVRHAIATAAACGLPLALSGTIGFLIGGWNIAGLPLYSTGFIYWPALIGIVFTSVIFAQLSAKLAHQVPVNILRYIFVLFLCAVGLRMLLQ